MFDPFYHWYTTNKQWNDYKYELFRMLVINLNKRVTMYVLVLTVVVCLIAGSASQEVHFGRCPKVTTVPNLDVNRVC